MIIKQRRYKTYQKDGKTLIQIDRPKVTEIQNWAKRYEIKNINTATRADLEKAVRKASKAANQRLLRLERDDRQESTVYQEAMKALGERGKRRFPETPKGLQKLTANELRQTYKALERFMTAQTSTVAGAHAAEYARYNQAVEKGYQGSLYDFQADLVRVFDKAKQKMYSSSILYDVLTSGTVDLLDEAIKEASTQERQLAGNILLNYRKKMRKRE